MKTYAFYQHKNSTFIVSWGLQDSGDYTAHDQAHKYAEFLSMVFAGEAIAFICVDFPEGSVSEEETLLSQEVN